jgi:hypothetical protein
MAFFCKRRLVPSSQISGERKGMIVLRRSTVRIEAPRVPKPINFRFPDEVRRIFSGLISL